MGKKNKKNDIVLDDSGIISECATSLAIAFEYALEHRDVDSMLAVSDRWLRLYAMISLDSEEKESLKMGFVGVENDQQ